MRKIVTLLTVLMLFCALAFAQTRTVTGTIKDENGNPVPFASIRIKGTNTGTSADANGFFSISSKTGDVLIISAVGASPKEFTVSSETAIATVSLVKQSQEMSEVVVTALGVKREKKAL